MLNIAPGAGLLADLVTASEAVGATSKRTEKVRLLGDLLSRLTGEEIPIAVGALIGEARQGRIGVGWATLMTAKRSDGREQTDPREQSDASDEAGPDGARHLEVVAPTDAVDGVGALAATGGRLTIVEFDRLLTQLSSTVGPGSVRRRGALINALAASTSPDEFDFVKRLLIGEVRHGALAGVMTDSIAKAAGVPPADVRKAAMLLGDLGEAARLVLTDGAKALAAVGLIIGRALEPMLASSAPTVAEALATTGPASVEWKLDGARIQVHRVGDEVRIFTRNLNEITTRLPRIVEAVRRFPAPRFVLDGEAIGLTEDGRPRAFQDTMSDFGADQQPATGLQAFFFDLLHLDGVDLLDVPLSERSGHLRTLVGDCMIPAITTDDPDEGQRFADQALAGGHEGVVVKALASTYEAGRRGSGWVKVKPVHTLDLVVLAAEWGHGRRRGSLSNLHLGARHPEDPTQFVMVGKTFKGLTDALLNWQTAELQALAIRTDGYTVFVKPLLVVEIAIDGVQRSNRYPGGVALRFARVRRYRDDKTAAEADTINHVRALLPAN